jgi:NAD(P)-dependent dehydrogenase (short-subunit alcohol dehydrogenase family)
VTGSRKNMDVTIKNKVALVTGSSSGMGFATAITMARAGIHTYASMRNLKKSKTITELASAEKLPLQVVQLDVNDKKSIKEIITKIVTEKERIDVLVNNAGYGLFGSLEDVSIEEMKAQFETNFFGVIRVTQLVLPIMRKQKSGTIVNVSSVGGRIALPILSAYQSTKFALEGLSESMSYELEPFGIKVVIIEPGAIRTNIMNSSIWAKKAQDPKSPYFSQLQRIKDHFKSMMENESSPPDEVAKVILEAITSENPQLRYTVGQDAATLIQARVNMPETQFKKMIVQNFLV